jgi:hypothetical protein
MLKNITIIAVAITLGCCSAADRAEDPVKWTSAPEDSVVAAMVDDVTSSITRCWKNEKSYECLRSAQNGPRTGISAFQSPEPRPHSEMAESGYSCEVYLDPNNGLALFKESISRSSETLLSNTVASANPASKPWTKADVRSFADENGIAMETQWFDCNRIANAISNGSLETIATTAIKRTAIFGI